MRSKIYTWQDSDDDVTGSIEAYPGGHPSIVGILRLVRSEDKGNCGIYVDVDQARELAQVLNSLADAHAGAVQV